MDKKQQFKKLLRGIEDEIKNLQKNKLEIVDFENRITELEKERREIKEELEK